MFRRLGSIWTGIVTGLSLAANAVGAGWAAVSLVGAVPAAKGVMLALFFAFIVVNVLIHELGHAAGARAAGWRVHLVSVAGLGYRVRQRRFHLPYGDRRSYRSFILATPGQGTDWDTPGWLLILAAGPLANFVSSAMALFAAELFRGDQVWPGLLLGYALAAVAMGIGNLIPFRRGQSRASDGLKILNLVRGRKLSEADKIGAIVSGLWHDGTSPREYDPSVIQRLQALAVDEPRNDSWLAMLFSYYLSTSDIVRAHAVMETPGFAERWNKLGVAAAHAFLIAMVERDPERALMVLNATPDARKDTFSYWRAMAVIHALKNEPDAARHAVAEARKSANGAGDEDDTFLFAAIERGDPVPTEFRSAA